MNQKALFDETMERYCRRLSCSMAVEQATDEKERRELRKTLRRLTEEHRRAERALMVFAERDIR